MKAPLFVLALALSAAAGYFGGIKVASPNNDSIKATLMEGRQHHYLYRSAVIALKYKYDVEGANTSKKLDEIDEKVDPRVSPQISELIYQIRLLRAEMAREEALSQLGPPPH